LILTDEGFLDYAKANYTSTGLKTVAEFTEDINRIIHIKRLMNRLVAGEDVSIRLILNHFVILFNMFDSYAAANMLFYKIEEDKWILLNTFLVYMKYSPSHLPDLGITLTADDVDVATKQELDSYVKRN